MKNPWTSNTVMPIKIEPDSETEKKTTVCYKVEELKPGQPVSILSTDKMGDKYTKAFILNKVPGKDTEMARYCVSYGRKRMRKTVSLTQIHAQECAE